VSELIGSAPPSAAGVRLAHALEQQAAALERVARVVAAARTGLPAARQSGFWRGEAHSRYVAAVDAAERHLEVAERQVATAALHTRRAIGSLAGRVG
jgi:hypothetical protein